MAPIAIKYVVSFTSQDEKHPVSNVLKRDSQLRWLSNPKEKNVQMDAVFQLEDFCCLSVVDVGTYWCGTLQILVGRSDWPQGVTFKTLVPTTCMMLPADCRKGNNVVKERIFQSDDFCEDAAKGSWDRIQVSCRQPFRRDVQFGLSFLRIRSKSAENEKLMSSVPKNVQSIQKHFGLDDMTSTPSSEVGLKSKLLKIAGSSENGSTKYDSLSRTASLVLRATESNVKTNPWLKSPQPNKPGMFSDHIAQKYTPTFEVEVDAFLSTLEIERSELDHVSIADLRHKLEKQKKRKLTSEEKKFFKEKTSDYIFSLFCEDDNSSGELTSHKEDRSQTCELNSSQELDLYLDTSPTQRDRKNSQTNGDSQCASVISNYLLDVTKTPQSKKGKQDKKQTLQNKPDSKGSIQRDKNRGFEKNKNHHPLSCVKTGENCTNDIKSSSKNRTTSGNGVTCINLLKSTKTGRETLPSDLKTNKKFSPIRYPKTPNVARPVSVMGWLSARKPPKGEKRGMICLSDDELGSSKSTPRKQVRNGDAVESSPDFGCFEVDLVEDEDCLMSPNAITRRGRGRGRGRKVTATRGGKSVKGGRGRSRGSAISAGQVSGVCPTSASTSKESSIYCDHCEGRYPQSNFPDHFDVCPGKSSSSSTSIMQSYTANSVIDSAFEGITWATNHFGSLTEPLTLVECPVCGMNFAKDRIEIHAAVCLEAQEVLFVG